MENNQQNGTDDVKKTDGFSADEDFNWEVDTSKSSLSDGVRKLLGQGLSAVMMSEDLIKQYLKDVNLPKDAAAKFIGGLSKSREEIVSRAGQEIGKLIEKIDVVEELTKFLRENKIKISAEVEFKKKDQGQRDE